MAGGSSSTSWTAARAKTQLRLAIQRTRLLASKKTQVNKVTRREIAALLPAKEENARIRVEALLGEEKMIELLELMELYCELLIARFGLLDLQSDNGGPDPGVAEAVAGIIHAAPRTEMRELHVMRDMLMHRFGREYSIACVDNEDGLVSSRVTSKLKVETPPKELVDAYLLQLARFYKVDWVPEGYVEPSADENATTTAVNNGAKAGPGATEDLPETIDVPPSEADHTVVLRTSLPSPSRVPKSAPAPAATATAAKKGTSGDGAVAPVAASKKSQEEDAFEALSRRFAELKKR